MTSLGQHGSSRMGGPGDLLMGCSVKSTTLISETSALRKHRADLGEGSAYGMKALQSPYNLQGHGRKERLGDSSL